MKEFKIRSSASGEIMGVKGLGKTGESYCQEWLTTQLYNRQKEFSNKYTQKGLIMEDDSIDFIAEQLGYGMLIKNEDYFENDFMSGTPDIIIKDLIIDVKNSWSCFSFPLFESNVPNKDYYWQAQCYMKLTNKTNFKLVYVLSDTPEHLIVSEVKRYVYSNGIDEIDVELYDEFKAKMTYSDIPDKFKIKVFDIKHNDEDIAKIESRVIECRKYINELLKEIK